MNECKTPCRARQIRCHASWCWLTSSAATSTIIVSGNDDFVGSNRLQRDPIYTVQAHVVDTLGPSLWLSAGLACGWGGESVVNGVNKDDTKGDFLAGVSLGVPISATQGLSFAYVRTRTGQDVGANTDALLVGWSVRFQAWWAPRDGKTAGR